MLSALVLNASFEPLSIVSAQRATCLVLADKADVLEDDGRAAVLYDGTTLREGAWRAIHGHVFIEPVGYCLREKDADGELTLQRKSVGRQGDTVVTFRKVK